MNIIKYLISNFRIENFIEITIKNNINHNTNWIDFYYDDVNNSLVFCITNTAPQTDWAVIAVTAKGVTKRISVSVNY